MWKCGQTHKTGKVKFEGALGVCLLASCIQIATGSSEHQPFGCILGEKGGPGSGSPQAACALERGGLS